MFPYQFFAAHQPVIVLMSIPILFLWNRGNQNNNETIAWVRIPNSHKVRDVRSHPVCVCRRMAVEWKRTDSLIHTLSDKRYNSVSFLLSPASLKSECLHWETSVANLEYDDDCWAATRVRILLFSCYSVHVTAFCQAVVAHEMRRLSFSECTGDFCLMIIAHTVDSSSSSWARERETLM